MKQGYKYRGIEAEKERDIRTLYRDVRTPFEFTRDTLVSRVGSTGVIIACIFMMFFFPSACLLFLLTGIIGWWVRKRSVLFDQLPFRMPKVAGGLDFSAPYPGRTKYKKSGGIFYVGNEIGTNKELWLTADDVLTHMMILGTTGSGKSETMVALAYNALAMGSGMFYIDPKAAPKLAHQMFTLCRIVGRDDDFKVQNFATDKRPEKQSRKPGRQTNTTNPFNQGTADQLTQLLTGLLPKSEGGNAVFAQNAQALITGLLYVLVELRDRGEVELSIETIRHYLDVYKCDELARRKDLSDTTRQALTSAMGSFGWNERMPLEKQQKVPEQFGFARSYFGLPLANLADSYGHLYMTPFGEVDMEDVILQRRVLVVLLPALEMAPQQLENLGKICLSAVKNACAIGLGSQIVGSNETILDSLPVDSPVPFLSITDEYAAITTPGYAEVFTQGRGLGIGGILGSQDYGGISGKDPTGAKQFVANTKVKLFMCSEDGQDTQDLIAKIAGKGQAIQTAGYGVDKQSGSSTYLDTLSTQIREVERMPFEDLNRQIEGEFIGFFKSNIVRGNSFYTDLKLKGGQLRIGQMVKVHKPDARALSMKRGALRDLADKLMATISEGKTVEYKGALPAGVLAIAEQLQITNKAFICQHEVGRQETAICALHLFNKARLNDVKAFAAGGNQLRSAGEPIPDDSGHIYLGVPPTPEPNSNTEVVPEVETPVAPTPEKDGVRPPVNRFQIALANKAQQAVTPEEVLPAEAVNTSRVDDHKEVASSTSIPTEQPDLEGLIGLPSLALLQQAWGSTEAEDESLGLDKAIEAQIEKQLDYPVAPTPKNESDDMLDELTQTIERLVNCQ